MDLLGCEKLSFAYDGKVVARDIAFTVQEGDYLCVLGENGSGKSTLLKGLLGLKAPAGGNIWREEGLQSKEIGYVPQQMPLHKDFPASVEEVVLSGRLGSRGWLPWYSREDKALARENMEKLHIEALARHCYRELSGGQQRRVLLARALCAAKKLLILDEPAAGLDPLVSQELYQLIQNINQELGLAIVMVSHDVEKSLAYAKHILHMAGRQLFFGTVKAYMDTEAGKHFLGASPKGGEA